MDEDQPTTQDLAQASDGAYTNSPTAPENYTKIPELTTPDISTYKHIEKPHYIIAHRGTDFGSNTKKKQLKADLNILAGNTNADKLHKKRAKDTENIIKNIKSKDDKANIYLTGHSLGGTTSQHAIIKSKYVRDNVKRLETFNAGTSPLNKPTIKSTSKLYKDIASKSTHHTISGDIISTNAKSSMIGKIKQYNKADKPTLSKRILGTIKSLAQSPVGYFGDKIQETLAAHSLSNFTKD